MHDAFENRLTKMKEPGKRREREKGHRSEMVCNCRWWSARGRARSFSLEGMGNHQKFFQQVHRNTAS